MATPSGAAPHPLAVFFERRTLVMLALGFASGLPNLLIFDTLSAWLRVSGLSLQAIAFFSLATLAYSLKFLWAPLVDRTVIPMLSKALGHRRSWMLASQAAVVLGLLAISGSNPATNLAAVALFAVFTGFASATQDIVIDAWRIEAAAVRSQGALAAAYQWGYRLAMITAGAAPLVITDATHSWPFAYLCMAGLMIVGVAAALAAPREEAHRVRDFGAVVAEKRPARDGLEWALRLLILACAGLLLGSGLAGKADALSGLLGLAGLKAEAAALAKVWTAKPDGVWLQLIGVVLGLGGLALAVWPLPGRATRPGAYLGLAFGEPLRDFFSRYGRVAGLILAMICVYRLSDFVLNVMKPFYLDIGFTLTQIAEATKVFGVVMSMLGVFGAGAAIARYGLRTPLIFGAAASPLTHLSFAWLATLGAKFPALMACIAFDNFASGFAGTCLIAFMSSLTTAGFTATQYALFSSLYALPGKLIASQSGRVVEGAAHAARPGGGLAGARGLFGALPPQAFVKAAAKMGVDAPALGAGYLSFFLYSGALGLVGVGLAVAVARSGVVGGPRAKLAPTPAGPVQDPAEASTRTA